MITRLEGELVEFNEQALVLQVQGLYYEVYAAPMVISAFQSNKPGERVQLFIYHYLQSDPSRSIPVLIGFKNRIEREFFEKFITVSGVGPKAALKALKVPISQIAQAIDCADIAFLKTLPGVGEQRAREIVAKLQGKVGRFALIQDGAAQVQRVAKEDFHDEALAVLLQLQYRKDEASHMIQNALKNNSGIKTTEELLNAVYRQRNAQPAGT